MKKCTLLFLVAVLAALFVLPAQADPLKIVAAHNQTSLENPYQHGMMKFKEVLEKISGGEISVDVHAGTIGTNEDELVEKLQLGAADVVVASPGFMTKIGIPEVDLFSLLYLFNSFGHWEKASTAKPDRRWRRSSTRSPTTRSVSPPTGPPESATTTARNPSTRWTTSRA